jgi:hypothetical protein
MAMIKDIYGNLHIGDYNGVNFESITGQRIASDEINTDVVKTHGITLEIPKRF